MDNLPKEILQIIADITQNWKSIIMLNGTSTKLRKIKVKRIGDRCYCGINDKNIKYFTELEIIYVFSNRNITNINHLTKLKTLHASWCAIDDRGIKGLINLEQLNLKCSNIENINHLAKLKILDISGKFNRIGDSGINKLQNIEKLYADDNPNITNINHLKKLRILNASGKCGISDAGINELKNLEEVCAYYNPKITKKIFNKI